MIEYRPDEKKREFSSVSDRFHEKPHRVSWLLIPFIFIIIVILKLSGEGPVWNPSQIIPLLNVIFMTPISILISILAARSYHREKSLSILFLGCGTLAFGVGAALTIMPSIAKVGNSIVTMYMTATTLAALCHLMSAISLSKSHKESMKSSTPVLIYSYLLIIITVFILYVLVSSEALPKFFIAGSGQTITGLSFIVTTISAFTLSAILLWKGRGEDRYGFYYYYAVGLILIAVGLTGVSLQSNLGDPLNWVGRSSQYIGTMFMLIAALSPVRERGTWLLPMERALRESEDRYQSLVRLSPYAILVECEKVLIFANPAAVKLIGASSQDDLIGTPILDYIHPDHQVQTEKNLERMQSGESLIPWDSKFILSDRRAIDVEISGSRVEFGTNPAIQVIVRDITEKKKVEDALRESETKYRGLFENIQEAVVLRQIFYDENGRIDQMVLLDANPAYLRILGVSSIEEVRGKMFSELYSSGSWEWTRNHIQKMIDTGSPFTEESHYDFNERQYITTSVLIGKDYTLSTGMDITERKKVEWALRESNEYLERLIGYANAPIIVWDPNFTITRFNHAFEILTGITASEAVGSKLTMLFPESSKDSSMKLIHMAMDGRQWEAVEIPILNRSGQVRTVLWNSANIMGQDGNLRAIIAQGQDITERKWAEAALKESEKSLNEAQHIANIGSWRWNLRTGDISWSDALYSIYGVESSTFVPHLNSFMEFLHPDDREFVNIEIQKLLAGVSPGTFDFRILLADGSIRIINATAEISEFDENGKPTMIAGTNQDITERKNIENRIRTSNAELQQFAYVASHDLQEPLRMVVSYLTLLERKYQDKLDPKGQEYIHYAVDGGKRMRELIDDLLEYSRVETKGRAFEPVDMNEVVQDTIMMLKVPIEQNDAEIVVRSLPTITADGSQMEQLMRNLVANAIKFHREERPRVEISSRQVAGEYIFTVKDNGIGIDTKYQEKLFQMFQRLHTRDEYEGTGIGLAISKKIVERHGGRIWYESDGKNGTTIYFTISKVHHEAI